ncbi:hypothetical protein [Sulfidibacter corallicola]|uniref:Uncharacterized protein n=1 Tax=Sulfidibacter corallicola TaxID=2818388 RepID=A0A8A4TPZ5_SULCO|nr:hypothetical protein [Sulfidibacter corallicola]QTD52039.1 hypothetical protein J3U87_06160 [Sulfidibacter corallicola]
MIRLASMVMTRVQHAAFYTVIALIAWFAFSFFQKARPIWIMGKAFFTIQLSLWMIHLLAGIATGFISRITSFAKPGAPHGGMRLMHFERATHDHIANSTIEFILYVLVVGLVYAAYKRRMAGERNSAKSRDQPSKPPPIPKGPDIEPEPAPPPPPIPGSR